MAVTEELTIKITAAAQQAMQQIGDTAKALTSLGAASSQASNSMASGNAVLTAYKNELAQLAEANVALNQRLNTGQISMKSYDEQAGQMITRTKEITASISALAAEEKLKAAAEGQMSAETKASVAGMEQEATAARELTSSMSTMATAHGRVVSSISGFKTEVKAAETAVVDLAGGVKKAADTALYAAGGFSHFAAIFSGGLAAGGLLFGFYQLIQFTLSWDQALAHLSATFSGNVQAASTWMAIGKMVGVSGDQLNQTFTRLATAIDQNRAVLHQWGVATVDAQGKSLDLETVLENLRQKVNDHAGALLNVAKVQEIFGRGTASEILPLLQLTAQQWALLTERAKELGLVVDAQTASSWRYYDQQLGAVKGTLEALMLDIGHAAMGPLAMLANAVETLIRTHLPQLTQWLYNVASALMSFIEGITGVKMSLDPLAATLAQVTDAMNQQGQDVPTATDKLNDYTVQIEKLQRAEQDATDAIQQQSQAIQDAANSQVYGIQQTLAAMDEQQTVEEKLASIERIRQEIALKDSDIQRLKQQIAQASDYGDYAQLQSLEQQLASAQADRQNQSQDLQSQTHAIQLAQTKYQLQQEEEAIRHKTELELQALRNEEQAVRRRYETEIRAIEDAQKSEVVGAASATAAVSNQWTQLADGIQTKMSAAGLDISAQFSQDGTDASNGFLGKFKENKDWESLGEMIKNQITKGTWADDAGKQIGAGIIKGMMGFLVGVVGWVGEFLAANIIKGVGITLRDTFGNLPGPLGDPGKAAGNFLIQSANNLIGQANKDMGFAEGGFVPGAEGAPVLATIHGGELVLNRAQQQMLGVTKSIADMVTGGGDLTMGAKASALGLSVRALSPGSATTKTSQGTTIAPVFHIYGVTDPEAVGKVVEQKMAKLLAWSH